MPNDRYHNNLSSKSDNILTSFIETVQTQMINISNADMAIINTNAMNSANACMNVICVELIDGELFSRINSILMTTNTMYGFIHVYMENQNTEFYTFEDSLKYLYTYMLFCRDDRMEEFKDTLLQYLTRHFKDVEMSRLIASRMQNLNEDVKVVLTESEFNKIEKITLKDVKINNDCGICLCPYEESDEIVKLKCNHCYHVECIKTQLCSYSSKCPMCKAEVEGEKQII